MTDSWVTCSVCGNRYVQFMTSCPMCNTPNNSVASPAKKSNVGKIAAGVVVAGVVVVALFMLAPMLIGIAEREGDNPVITILQPREPEPKIVATEELVQHALDLINKDRADFGLAPVKLSDNQAAQAHAEDVFSTKTISHWMTNGEKPYMTYTRYGGEGSVQQNVAIAGFSPEQYEECRTSLLVSCERIDPRESIQDLEYEMMYNDKECCNDGHRDNILNPHHTHVSIGIVYDRYYIAVVQNFENNYGLDVQVNKGQVKISGQLLKGELQQISIYYDQMPTRETYDQNKERLSYSAGDMVANVVMPLPIGYYYEKPDGYALIEADRWDEDGRFVNVTFDLAPAVKDDGVYTLFAIVKDGSETFDATSYAVFVDSIEASE